MDALTVSRCESVRFTSRRSPSDHQAVPAPRGDLSRRLDADADRARAARGDARGEVVATFSSAITAFAGRHRDLDATFERNFAVVAEHFDRHNLLSEGLSQERRLLIGAYFTHEYSIEAAALGNPSIVAAPDQSGVDVRSCSVHHESPGDRRRASLLDRVPLGRRCRRRVGRARRAERLRDARPVDRADLTRRATSTDVSFPPITDISERVLFPRCRPRATEWRTPDSSASSTTTARHLLRDVHGVRRSPDPAAAHRDRRLRDVPGHRRFRGRQRRTRAWRIFPRRINGRYVALGRHDNVNNFVMTSTDVRVWETRDR